MSKPDQLAHSWSRDPVQEKHFGFEVRGHPPGAPRDMVSDLFELRQVAIECAQYLAAAGWGGITCDEIGTDEMGDPVRKVIQFAIRGE